MSSEKNSLSSGSSIMTNDQSSLLRVLGRGDVMALSFGAMIGWGWVVLAGDWVNSGGALGAILAFIIGGLMVYFVGLTYAELISAMPKAGGELFFSWRGLGIKAAFVAAWAITLGYVSVVAFQTVAFPTIIRFLLPGVTEIGYLWTVAGWDVYATWVLVGMVTSLIMAGVNYLGIRPAAVLQAVLVGGLALIGIVFIVGSWFAGNVQNMEPLFLQPFIGVGISGIVAVLLMTPFMYVGFDVLPQAAEETKIPYRSIGVILLFSIVLAALWYIFIILGVSLMLPHEGRGAAALATAEAMTAVFNTPLAAKVLIIAGICGSLTSWNAFYIAASRIIYGMARAKMLPEFLGILHPKYKTPYFAIILVCVTTILTPLLGRPVLVWLVNAGSFAVVVAFVLVALSFLVLRYKEPNMPRPYKVAHGKIVGIMAIALSIFFVLLYLPGISPAPLSLYEWGFILGWMVLGLFFYWWAKAAYGSVADGLLREIVNKHEQSL